MRRMIGVVSRDQPVEKATAALGRLSEQPIHLRRQPDQAQDRGQCRLAFGRRPVKPQQAPFPAIAFAAFRSPVLALGRLSPGAQTARTLRRHDLGRHRPAPDLINRDATMLQVSRTCATQAASRPEQRNGFQQIGLARAVGSGEDQGPGIERQFRRAVGPEVGDRKTAKPKGRPACVRSGIGGCFCPVIFERRFDHQVFRFAARLSCSLG